MSSGRSRSGGSVTSSTCRRCRDPGGNAGRRLRFQVAIGGGDDAHIDGDFLLRTNRPDTPLLQHPQQPGLRSQRQFGNFVEKQRTAPGVVEQALAVLLGAGIGP